MLKFASRLTEDANYVFPLWGQSNARPWGNRDQEGYVQEPDMALQAPGRDLQVTSVAAGAVVVADTLVANELVGGEVRMLYQVRGNANISARLGRGTVTANTTGGLTVDWATSPPALPVAVAVVLTAATPGLVTSVAHAYQVNDRAIFTTTGTLPPELVSGTTYYVSAVPTPDTFSVSATLGGASLAFSTAGSGTITASPRIGAYVHHNDAWKGYSSVRVLTPFQPEEPGGYPTGTPTVPGYTIPASVTTPENLALFLDFGWGEGVEGAGYYGLCTETGGVVTLTGSLPSWVLAAHDDLFIGATVMLKNATGGRWLGVAINSDVSSKTVTVSGWTPATTPSGTLTVEVHLPHWRNNPHHALEGFRYPSNDMQPGATNGSGYTYNRPKGYLTASYVGNDVGGIQQHRFGAMVAFAWRMAAMLGKRVHMVHLGINAGSLQLANVPNTEGYKGTIGWWDWRKYADWTPSNPSGSAARLKRMLAVMVSTALQAEGNVLPAKVLGILGFQGESDALSATGRASYQKNLPQFYAWLRAVVSGMSPYVADVRVPVVHASLPPFWANATYLGTAADTEEKVNAAIADFVARDGFARTFSTDASPTLDGTTAFGLDPRHFNGKGEADNAALAAEAMGQLIDGALAFGLGDAEVAAANEALSIIGEPANVTSLSPPNATRQAQLCAQFFNASKRAVLQHHPWSCATKRATLLEVTNTVSTWTKAYGVPADLLSEIDVLDPAAPDDMQVGSPTVADPSGLPVTGLLEDSGQFFRVETENGVRILRTDQENAVLRYVSSNVGVDSWDPLMVQALTFHLAHKLVGATVKGKIGGQLALQYLQAAMSLLDEAARKDAQSGQKVGVDRKASWLP